MTRIDFYSVASLLIYPLVKVVEIGQQHIFESFDE